MKVSRSVAIDSVNSQDPEITSPKQPSCPTFQYLHPWIEIYYVRCFDRRGPSSEARNPPSLICTSHCVDLLSVHHVIALLKEFMINRLSTRTLLSASRDLDLVNAGKSPEGAVTSRLLLHIRYACHKCLSRYIKTTLR
jgi:hypothetical protein